MVNPYRDLNEDEVVDLMQFAAQKGAILQIIEFEMERERTSSEIFSAHHVSLDGVRQWLLSTGRRNGANPLHNRERFVLEVLPDGQPLQAPVEVELVAPMHNTEFCNNCSRIRLTAGGFVKGSLEGGGGTRQARRCHPRGDRLQTTILDGVTMNSYETCTVGGLVQ